MNNSELIKLTDDKVFNNDEVYTEITTAIGRKRGEHSLDEHEVKLCANRKSISSLGVTLHTEELVDRVTFNMDIMGFDGEMQLDYDDNDKCVAVILLIRGIEVWDIFELEELANNLNIVAMLLVGDNTQIESNFQYVDDNEIKTGKMVDFIESSSIKGIRGRISGGFVNELVVEKVGDDNEYKLDMYLIIYVDE